MLRLLRQARTAITHLNPEEVRKSALLPVRIGLVASHPGVYEEMEDFFHAGAKSPTVTLHRDVAGDPADYDVVLYERGVPAPEGALTFHPDQPVRTITSIVEEVPEVELALARNVERFRQPVVQHLIHKVARENALFSIGTSIPNVVPLLGLGWAIGEFASDTAFLTMNQIRMAFLIAGANGREIGYEQQKVEIGAILAGALGWRAIARELVSKIPLGGGVIPKGAIAYAGTYVIGKGLERYHRSGVFPTDAERRRDYDEAYERGLIESRDAVEKKI